MMVTKMQKAKLKNGKKVNYAKVDDHNLFVNVGMADWQMILLIFIVILSILLSFAQMQFTADSINKVWKDVQEIQYGLGLGEFGNSTFIGHNENLTSEG